MKNTLKKLLILPFLFTMASCGTPESSKNTPVVPLNMREGYEETYDGFKSRLHWIMNEESGKKIYSRIFVPNDFSETKEYPTLIMSHGYNSSSENGDNALVKNVLSKGMLCVTYDFCGGATLSKSQGKTTDMSFLTERSDLQAVLKETKGYSYTKNDSIVLFGQSFGGLVTAITAPTVKEDVCGFILQAPALGIENPYQSKEEIPETIDNMYMKVGKGFYEAFFDVDIIEEASKWDKTLMVYVGTEDSLMPSVKTSTTAAFGDKRQRFLEDTEDVYVEDGVHIVKDAPHSFQTNDFIKIMPEINEYLKSLNVISE